MCNQFEEVQVKYTPDQLARLASNGRKQSQLRTTLHLELPQPSVDATECLAVSETEATKTNAPWMTELLEFILHGKEPADALAAKKLCTQVARFSVVGTELYKRGFSTPLLKCIGLEQADYILREVYEGICGSHSGGRTLVAKVLRAGYYWPTLKSDCAHFVKRCVQCQKHGNLIHASAEQLHSISSPWPFALWGMDILGPFPIAKG
uniref:Gypsy retrotransposon integrase-like protein 1 n=1 Tax=Cajanus cajan TaxID=3821 RepID=A0A151UBI0_CAJCA|nr:Gypsy retrotransposon integrase-like protein 1 [Cajanus cajan]